MYFTHMPDSARPSRCLYITRFSLVEHGYYEM